MRRSASFTESMSSDRSATKSRGRIGKRSVWYFVLSCLIALLVTALISKAAGPYPEPAPPNGALAPAALPAQLTNAPFRQLSSNLYQIGSVRFDKQSRTITFPAQVNMAEGAVEYALVHASGKVHESVLKTDVDPAHIHLAKLLLGTAEPNRTNQTPAGPRELLGPKVSIEVQWTTTEGKKQAPLENLVWNILLKAPMTPGPWIYSGSRVVDGTFLAQRDGSLIAIISDPDALINNPRPGRESDDIWQPNPSVVPPVGTPVEVSIRLLSEGKL